METAFAAAWRSGLMPHGSYFRWLRDWKAHANAHPDQILWLHDEDVLSDPTSEIRKLANFIDVDVSDEEFLFQVVNASSFASMKKQAGGAGDWHLRKGIAGDWRAHFSEPLAESFIKEFQTECRGSGLSFSLGSGNGTITADE
jgi:hypothetical protein